MAQDASGLVRCTLAQHVADLAEIALKFLELSHWRVEANVTTPTSEIPGGALNWCNTNGFESELQALQVIYLGSNIAQLSAQSLTYLSTIFAHRNHFRP